MEQQIKDNVYDETLSEQEKEKLKEVEKISFYFNMVTIIRNYMMGNKEVSVMHNKE